MPRLRRSDCSRPGIRRRRHGRGFVYLDTGGGRIGDQETLTRIRALAVPPAWVDVWICPWPNGHIQALGTDARGRRQYRYHDVWRIERDRQKFDHVLEVARSLPEMRRVWRRKMAGPELSRERVLAGAARLLDLGLFRIGGEAYAEENGTFGLATMQKGHVRVGSEDIVFAYPAKTGKRHVLQVADPAVRELIVALKQRRGGGPGLLAYRDGRRWVDVRSSDINAYLRTVSGLDITAKDFRTWNATVLAAVSFAWAGPPPPGDRARRRVVRRVMEEVAGELGNTPTVCRASYVDPRVVDLYQSGVTVASALDARPGADVRTLGGRARAAVEAAVLDLLDDRSQQAAA